MNPFRSSLFIIVMYILSVQANPIIEVFFNELTINPDDSYGWILEFDPQSPPQANYYLTSSSDTAYFTHGYDFGTYLLITSDSLSRPLAVNPAGDVLRLYSQDGIMLDEIAFGNGDTVMVRPPQGEMSISVYNYYEDDTQTIYKYLEAPPTLGGENHLNSCQGYITGLIQDESGQPLANVAVNESSCYSSITHYFNDQDVSTNQQGQFTIHKDARYEKLLFSKEGYQDFTVYQQIWPDSTVDLGVLTMYFVNSLPQKNDAPRPENYHLSQNYPNPFNAQTQITYYLPYSDMVTIAIYNMQGQKLRTLYSGYQEHGRHRLNWDATNLASGIYIYRLHTSETVLSKKCVLIK